MTLYPAPNRMSGQSDDLGTVAFRAFIALEIAAAIFAVFLFCDAHVKLIVGNNPDNADSPLLRVIWLPFYAIGVMGLVLGGRRAFYGLLIAIPFLAFAILAMVSTLWSGDPDLTSRRGFALLMTTVFGVYLGVRFSWRTFAEIVAAGMALVAIGSAVLAIAVPSLGLMQDEHAGAWAGLVAEKNQLGAAMVRGLVASVLAMALAPPSRRWLWGCIALLCIAEVLLSTSKTSLLALAAAVAILCGVRIICFAPNIATAGTWAAVSAVAFFLIVTLQFPEEFLRALGREPTLTSRTDIWAAIQPFMEAKPWLGWGYQAFWRDPLGPAVEIRNQLDFHVRHAHHGWRETMLGNGYVGTGLMALCLLMPALASLVRIFVWPYGACVLAFVASLFIISLSEATLGGSNSIITVLLVAYTIKLLLPDPPSLAAPVQWRP